MQGPEYLVSCITWIQGGRGATAMIKGTFQRDFWHLGFFSSLKPALATDQWVKYFRFWLIFRRVIQTLMSKKVTCKEWYHGEKDSPGYNTPGSHVLADFLLTRRGMRDTPGRLTCWGIIHRGDWLAWVSYTGETKLLGYHTLGSQIFELKILITQRIKNS